MSEAEELRACLRERWDTAAEGWGRRAQEIRAWGLPVSRWLIEHLDLRPGLRVLELAAGPGDTGFLAAEVVAQGDDPLARGSREGGARAAGPRAGGSVICSDGSEAMLEVARRRAAELGVQGVEFRRLELEWIDLPTASVDRIVCRWGLMLALDPGACLSECRRVLRPGGALALAVWDGPEHNPWLTAPTRALVELAGVEPPPEAPGVFALASARRLAALLKDAGFTHVELDAVQLQAQYENLAEYLEERRGLSPDFAAIWRRLDERTRQAVGERVATLLAAHAAADGRLRLPGRSLVAIACA